MVWTKIRNTTGQPIISDSLRTGSTYYKWLYTDANSAEVDTTYGISALSSDGYTLGVNSGYSGAYFNQSGQNYASWTFRKAPKFFDVVTWTGDGTTGRSISHNLGGTVGWLLIKRTDSTGNWVVYHRSLGETSGYPDYLLLESTAASASGSSFLVHSVSDSSFVVGSGTGVNASGGTYVAYLFAHNDGDGGFGINGNQDIIKCGSYTGNGSLTGPEIDLGFEPQWLLVKRSNTGANWLIIDNMRGFTVGDINDALLYPNLNNAEVASNYYIQPTPTGFQPVNSTSETNASGGTYVYIAIRRGPMAVPTDAADVFAIDTRGTTAPAFNAGFPIDAALYSITNITYDKVMSSRLTQTKVLDTNNTGAQSTFSAMNYDYQEGYHDTTSVNTNTYSWMWRRAPNFFDVVPYTGTGSSLTVDHNLGVEPDMIWLKDRSGTNAWIVQGKVISPNNNSRLELNDTMALTSVTTGVTALTSTSFTLGTWNNINYNNANFIAYLFASLDGVSKVGSYTGDGNTEQNIDCGFSAGARFVLIKKSSHTGSWFLFDSERGIISGNSPYLELNTSSAQSSSYNELSPYSSGFTVRNGGGLNLNYNGHTFVFYAIA
jgi:hypothetical protein